MPCKPTEFTTTRRKDKDDDDTITTTNTKRVCSPDPNDLKEQDGEAVELLEPWEEMVYPSSVNAAPELVDVVVRNTETQQKFVKKVPRWAVDDVPSPEMIQTQLLSDNELKEAFARFLK